MSEKFSQQVVSGDELSGDANGHGGEQWTFQDRVGNFLNPDIPIGLDEQLAFTQEFWGMLTDHKPPELSESQKASIAEEVEAHPERRVMPTPFLDFAGRKAIAEKARAFPGSQFAPDFDALWVEKENTVYGKLARDPDGVVEEKGKSYGLRYKLPHDKKLMLAGRADFMRLLEENGQAVRADDGTLWVYPVMDVRVRSKRMYIKSADLFVGGEATVIPESLIAMQLLHQANGTPNSRAADIPNEAVYRLKNGKTKKIVGPVAVHWNARSSQVCLSFAKANAQSDGYGALRYVESGLNGVSDVIEFSGTNETNGAGGLEGFPPGTYL